MSARMLIAALAGLALAAAAAGQASAPAPASTPAPLAVEAVLPTPATGPTPRAASLPGVLPAAPASRSASAPAAPAGRLGRPDAPGWDSLRTGRSTTGVLSQMLASLLVVCVLAVAAMLALRKLAPKLKLHSGKNLAVVEALHLGPRKSLHLLQVGNRRYLVAGSRDQVSVLVEVTAAFPFVDQASRADEKLAQEPAPVPTGAEAGPEGGAQ